MATNSIYNNIKVTDKKFCQSLVKAMEDSKQHTNKNVIISRTVEKLNKEQIEKIFGVC